MSILGDIVGGGLQYTGNKKAKRAQEAALAQAKADLNTGYTSALGSLDTGQSALEQGYAAGTQQRQDVAGKLQGAASDTYGTQKELWAPWMAPGLNAYQKYSDLISNPESYNNTLAAYSQSPEFKFQMQQATDQVRRQAAAAGNRFGGNQLAALSDRATNVANQNVNQWLDRLQTLANTGFQATGQLSNAASNYGSALGNALQYGDTSQWDVSKGKDILDINKQRGDLALQKASDLAGLAGMAGQVGANYALSQGKLMGDMSKSILADGGDLLKQYGGPSMLTALSGMA